MKKIKPFLLISLLCLSVFMACKKGGSPHPVGCECPARLAIWNQWHWVSTRNGNGQLSNPQAGSTVVLSLLPYPKYIAIVNGQALDSGTYSLLGPDTLKFNTAFKPTGGLNLPDSLYNIQFGGDSLYMTSMPNSSSGNTTTTFAAHTN